MEIKRITTAIKGAEANLSLPFEEVRGALQAEVRLSRVTFLPTVTSAFHTVKRRLSIANLTYPLPIFLLPL